MRQHITYIAFFVIAVVIAGVSYVGVASANPSSLYVDQDQVATTTRTYMTPGTATTTNTFDTQEDSRGPADSSVLQFCFTASTTDSTLDIGVEYSQDQLTWFADHLGDENASTSPAISLNTLRTYTYTYASTTPGGGGNGGSENHACKLVDIPTPTRYVRAFFSVTGANGAVWSDWTVKKQNR